jgi:prepilin-type N-terminal cleavage/methylation domain-containing protein
MRVGPQSPGNTKEDGPATPDRLGFTLVEMSIVLVVIALVIGGILAGRELIGAARIRATVSQIEMFNIAVNTFHAKYTGLPGDLEARKAAMFGFAARSGGEGAGDGNGRLTSPGVFDLNLGGETAIFWRDLSQAGLIKETFLLADENLVGATTAVKDYLPFAELGRGNFFAVFSWEGFNHYQMFTVTEIGPNGVYRIIHGMPQTPPYGVTPIEAFSLDNKTDDGLPMAGKTVARGKSTSHNETLNAPPLPMATGCVSNTAGNPYNLTGGYDDDLLCYLRFQMN